MDKIQIIQNNQEISKFDLGKPTKRGIKRCPECGTINGTRGARCKNKKCNILLRDNSLKLNTFTQTLTNSTNATDAIRLVTDSPLELFSIRINNKGTDYRGIVELPILQDVDGQVINRLNQITSSTSSSSNSNELNKILCENAKCHVDNCLKQIKSQQTTVCQHILLAIECKKEAQPCQLKSSSVNSLDIAQELKEEIMQLACNTTGPLVQRLSKETFIVKCLNEEKYPFGFLHIYFHDIKDKNEKLFKKFCCTCSYYKRMIRLKICDIPSLKRHCIHYYSALATFLSDDDLNKEFECLLMNKELSNLTNNFNLNQQLKQIKCINFVDTKVVNEKNLKQTSQPAPITTSTSPSLNNNNPTSNSSISIIPNSQKSAINSHFVNIQKKQPSLLIISKNSNEDNNVNSSEMKTNWLFLEWLSGVTEQINETMHYQVLNETTKLIFRIPNTFFECLQQRIAYSTILSNNLNKKIRMPNTTQEIERNDQPPFGIFIKYTWNIYNINHVKSIFDTQNKTLDLHRSFVQRADQTYELYSNEKLINKNLTQNLFFKTYLKVGKTKTESTERQQHSVPFIIEWIPNLFPKSQIGELTILFEFGHLDERIF